MGARDFRFSRLTNKGKLVVLNFWTGLCPPCRAEMPSLHLFHNKFKDRVTLIGIDIGQHIGLCNQNDARKLLNQLEITCHAGFIDDASVIQRYEVLAMPTTYFITSHGRIFRKSSGVTNENILLKTLEEMLDSS